MEAYTKYNVDVIDKNNKNPLWSPYTDKFSFISDPHQYKTIEIPFYEAAEVSGSVMKKIEGKLMPLSQVVILFENTKTFTLTKIRTLSDGCFYNFGIQPGEYRIFLEEEQLKRKNLKATPEFYIERVYSISSDKENKEFNFIIE